MWIYNKWDFKMNAFVSWSGGKDATLSFYKAVREYNLEVKYLLNMVSEDGKKSRTHGIGSKLLLAQSEAIEIPILQRPTSWNTYEKEFIEQAKWIKEQGISIGVFGDIDLQEHRDWVERVCSIVGIDPLFPIWQKDREQLLNEFIAAGFETQIVSVRSDLMGKEWLGRKIDASFIEDLKKYPFIDLCGEKGEFHSFVTNGPIFKKQILLTKTGIISEGNHHFWDIMYYEVIDKQ
jgi:diphthine-ammonia ligase